jgi:hypothetical protein
VADFNLILGPIVFRDFEIPSKINFGTEQAHHIHKLIGGSRVIDKLGPDPRPIHWEGRFRGAQAEGRARSCERLCNSGAEVPVRYGGYTYSVIVSHFEADYERFYEIPYKIALTVSGVGGIGGFVASIGSLIAADMGSIAALGAAL